MAFSYICLVLPVIITVVNGVDFCNKKVDLAFVIDSSVSISRTDFQKQINFVYDIVNYLEVGPRDTRVAAVSFSNYLHPLFGFSASKNKAEILKSIRNIQHKMGDATRTYLALEYIHKKIYALGNGERPDKMDVIVVLTDGRTNPGSYDSYTAVGGKKQTQLEAQTIKDRPAKVFGIGVGNRIDKNEINGISSDPDSTFSIFVDSFSSLDSDYVKTILLNSSCPVTTTTTTTTTTTPKPQPKTTPDQQIEPNCTEHVADVFFVLDESSSLQRQENFGKTLDFVISVVETLDIGPGQAQVGVMKFSDNPVIEFYLNEAHTREEIAQRVKQIRWKGGNTFLDRALQVVRTDAMVMEHGSRASEGIPQIVIVITDGVSTDPKKTALQLQEIHKLDINMFAIGVGPKRNITELQSIASKPANVMEVEHLDDLLQIKQSLLTRLCAESNLYKTITGHNTAFKKPDFS